MRQYKIYYHPKIPQHCQIGYIHNRLELKSVSREEADLYFWWRDRNTLMSKVAQLDDKYCINGNLIDTSYGFVKRRVKQFFGFTYDKAEGVPIRIPYIFGEIPFVITELMGRVVFIDPEEVFDPLWLENFKLFCEDYLDYGEVSVVDRYVISVDPAPSDDLFFTVSGKQKEVLIKTVSALFLRGIRDNLWKSQSEIQE